MNSVQYQHTHDIITDTSYYNNGHALFFHEISLAGENREESDGHPVCREPISKLILFFLSYPQVVSGYPEGLEKPGFPDQACRQAGRGMTKDVFIINTYFDTASNNLTNELQENFTERKKTAFADGCDILYLMMTAKRSCSAVISAVSLVALILLRTSGGYAAEKMFRAQTDDDGIQRVKITGGEYYFDPDHIIVKVNTPVELTIIKTPGITPHNIIIKAPEAGIDINENMGSKLETVTFTPLKTGRFEIYCEKRFLFFKNHKERGMHGVLEVIE